VGVTVKDGGDPVAVNEVVASAVDHARGGGGPTLVESLVYRLSAHGNIIAPPGVPLHFPEHEAITVFGNAEEYEAAKRGDPVPRFRARRRFAAFCQVGRALVERKRQGVDGRDEATSMPNARTLEIPPNTSRADQLATLEQRAGEHGLGLWGAC